MFAILILLFLTIYKFRINIIKKLQFAKKEEMTK